MIIRVSGRTDYLLHGRTEQRRNHIYLLFSHRSQDQKMEPHLSYQSAHAPSTGTIAPEVGFRGTCRARPTRRPRKYTLLCISDLRPIVQRVHLYSVLSRLPTGMRTYYSFMYVPQNNKYVPWYCANSIRNIMYK